MNKTFREHSKTNYAPSNNQSSSESINTLQRIADAVELMAKDRVEMERLLKFYKHNYERRGIAILELEKQIRGLKSAKSKFKNQLDKAKEGGSNG